MTPQDLQNARTARNMTQAQFAQALGVSLPSISNWERGISPVPSYIPIVVASLDTATNWRAALVTANDLQYLPTTFPTPDAALATGIARWPLHVKYRPDHDARTVYFFMAQ